MAKEVVSYKCPNCGAPLEFSIETQQWECHFCNSTFTKEELDAFSETVGLSQPELASWEAEAFDEQAMAAYVCPNCGGRILADKVTAATFCPYCHNPTVIAARLEGEYKPARILPFQITQDHMLESLRKLIRFKPLLPKEFRQAVEQGDVTGMYVPFWLFSVNFQAQMQAEGRRIMMWSDSRYHYTKTDIYQVRRDAMVPFEKVPADASQRMDDQLMDSLEPFDYSQMVPFSMEYLSGHFAETYDVDAQASRDRFLGRAHTAVEQVLSSTVHGYNSVRVMNLQKRPYNLDNLYVMLPVWTASVQHRGDIYTFAMNGQTGKSAGKLPVSRARFAGLFASIFLVVGLAVFVALMMGGGIW